MMTATKNKNSILSKLQLREKLDSKILKGYKKILDPVFLGIYRVSHADISWDRIMRLSLESNFVLISGKAVIPKGSNFVDGRIVKEDIHFNHSMTIPWIFLDNGSSVESIIRAAQDIKLFSEIADATDFFELMRTADFNYEDLKLFLPEYDKIEDGLNPDIPVVSNTVNINLDDIVVSQVRATILERKDKE